MPRKYVPRPRGRDELDIGDVVEFHSTKGEGRWLRGTVTPILCAFFPRMCDFDRENHDSYRIRVAEGVWVIRAKKNCRRVTEVSHLPIDVVPHSLPLKFRWQHRTDTLLGPRVVECEGAVPPSVEGALVAVIATVKRQDKEIEELREERNAANRRANAAENLNSEQRRMLGEAQLKVDALEQQLLEKQVVSEVRAPTAPQTTQRRGK